MKASPRRIQRRTGGRSARIRCDALVAAQQLLQPGQPLPTMAEIADKAGVDKTSLYRRWGKLEALLHDAVHEQPYRGVPVPNTGKLRGDLTKFARAYYKAGKSNTQRTYADLLMNLTDEMKQEYWRSRYREIIGMFEHAVERGEIEPRKDWSTYVDLLFASWYFYRYARGETLPFTRVLQVVEIICAELRI